VNIRVRIKTLPLKQWEVGRELLRRIKKTFDARGIEIPFPQRTVHVEAAKALPPPGD
jgi:small conductance mechanosensitive channel